MRQIPVPQEIYRHFKGNLYQIVTIAEHSETGERLVVYQALYGDFQTYARPLSMFMEKTDKRKYPEAGQEYRFERLDKRQTLKGVTEGKEEAAGEVNEEAVEERKEKAQKEAAAEAKTTAEAKETTEAKTTTEAKETTEAKTTTAAKETTIEAKTTTEAKETTTETKRATEETKGAAIETKEITAENMETGSPQEQPEEGEWNLDPMVIEFLDASSYEERLNILSGLHHRITDDMINIMSTALDMEVKAGDIEERYAEFRSCLGLMERFECNRLRQ